MSVTIGGINETLAIVSASALNRNLDNLLTSLMEIGKDEADRSFSDANFYLTVSGDDTTNEEKPTISYTKVSEELANKEYDLVGQGRHIMFQEYGTGIGATHPEGHDYGYTEDSWSISHKREYHDKGYWHYQGKKLKGHPASMGMYNARKTIESNIDNKVEEVWK